MNLCLLLHPQLSSDDEADGTHRKLLGDTQQELRHCAAGWAALMLGEWSTRTSSTAQVKAGPAPETELSHGTRDFGLLPAGQQICKTGNPSTASASGGLLWQRPAVCGLWKKRGAPLERSWLAEENYCSPLSDNH